MRWRTEKNGAFSYSLKMIDKTSFTLDKLKAALQQERVDNLSIAERHVRFLARVTACGEGVDSPPTISEFLTWRQDYLYKGVPPRMGAPGS